MNILVVAIIVGGIWYLVTRPLQTTHPFFKVGDVITRKGALEDPTKYQLFTVVGVTLGPAPSYGFYSLGASAEGVATTIDISEIDANYVLMGTGLLRRR